jgi:hypothetical protein
VKVNFDSGWASDWLPIPRPWPESPLFNSFNRLFVQAQAKGANDVQIHRIAGGIDFQA